MKCARCGYHNLPGLETCGRCGACLAGSTGTAIAHGRPLTAQFHEIYPPRARNRSPLASLSEWLRRLTAPARAHVARATINLPVADWRPWAAVSWAVIPGVVQTFQGRTRLAAIMIGSTTTLCVAFCAAPRLPFSDAFLWLTAALSVHSVWDVANRSFAPSGRADLPDANLARVLRTIRLALLAVTVFATTAFTVLGILGRRYGAWTIRTDQASPAFRAGDAVLGRFLDARRRATLRRGEIVLYSLSVGLPRGIEVEGNGSGVERIIGLPGDSVEVQGGKVLVDGSPLPPSRLPLTMRVPVADFRVIVPAGEVCVWRGLTFAGDADAAAPAMDRYVLVPREQVGATVVAIWEPPSRRRWFR